ncbi:MAG TPA: hypothetical protein VF043_14190 [Ktedonobacteraceae bacterium]
MAVLIEIVCSVSQEESARAAAEAFCKATGGLLIGRRVIEETHELLHMVRLTLAVSVSKQTTALNQARQQHIIESFRYVTCDLVQISFDPPVNLREQMRNFPLHLDESWFPAIHDPDQAYVCMHRPLMSAKQAAWLLAHEVKWTFV